MNLDFQFSEVDIPESKWKTLTIKTPASYIVQWDGQTTHEGFGPEVMPRQLSRHNATTKLCEPRTFWLYFRVENRKTSLKRRIS